ncbi:MAG: iron-containing alcohol dehydrogenase [Lachnospiraceae bacterium]
MMTSYTLKMPKAVYSGQDSLQQIKTILGKHPRKVAVFSDQGIIAAGLLDVPLALIRETGAETVVLGELPAEPTCDEAQQVIDRFKQLGAGYIVAVGGGSVMDIAKLASILATDEYCVRDLLEQPLLGRKCVPSLMIPTTAGTGAEATPNSIVAVPERELKVGIVNPEMIPDAVILDAQMIRKLPRSIGAATGIDALAHAIECYTSNKANPFSDTFALEALDLIMNHIEQACDNQDDMEAKNKMLIAAFYAGVAITASGTTAVHALSYPLGGKYHIPHGVSNAMMLVPVMKFNEPVCRQRFARVYDRVAHDGDRTLSETEKSAWVIRRLDDIVRHLDIPVSLQTYGVPREDLEILVASGMAVQRLLVNNMREVTADDARALYLQVI